MQSRSIEDTKSLRLTCKQMDQTLATEVLHCITVDINGETFEREWSKLQYFAERSSCRLIQGIRRVGIKSLSFPVLDSESPGALRESVENVETAFEYCEEELKKCLYNALSSLTTVRTVRCVSHELFLNAVFCNFCP